MNLSDELSGCRITMPLLRREINSDISEEITLPDCLPEIRKVLYVKEALLPPSKFISGRKIEISGIADYTLVYVSADGRLCSAPASAEYSFSLPLDNMSDFEISEGLSVMAHTFSDGSSVRISSPRRLSLKSRLRTLVSVWGKMLACEKLSGEEEGIERLMRSGANLELLCESSDVITLEDEYTLPSAQAHISIAEASVFVNSARVDSDVLTLEGETVLRLTVENGGRYERVTRRLPFEAETELDGIELSESNSTRASGYVTDLSVKVEEGKAKIQASVLLEICVASNREIAYTADIYSTARTCSSRKSELDIPTALMNKNLPLSLNERVTLEELGIPDGAELVDVCASAVIDSAALEESAYVLRGNCRYYLIFTREGEYAYADLRLPIKYECDLSVGSGEIYCFDAVADVISCKGRGDGESVSLECELSLAISLFGKDRAEILESAELGELLEKRRGVFALCYPAPDDTAWSIAKRYAVEQSAVSGNPETDPFVMIEL